MVRTATITAFKKNGAAERNRTLAEGPASA
jgi:hypothetical protein